MEWHSVHSRIGMRNRKTRAFYILSILIPELRIKNAPLEELPRGALYLTEKDKSVDARKFGYDVTECPPAHSDSGGGEIGIFLA